MAIIIIHKNNAIFFISSIPIFGYFKIGCKGTGILCFPQYRKTTIRFALSVYPSPFLGIR